ncbi:hypothetical protein [Hyalangium rubrum]|uniref:Outer membrane protein beta-barrel domain-containing protein n=1 Tax=Hyalangium rubrum TaxID=3103134 RepID=A0ABU5H4W5_9BACT|nr:hypothetical protein [Hyalangium sp. s54d21]MDY7228533.1 hypothetical protein [Hyalangium sp. s54d21]
MKRLLPGLILCCVLAAPSAFAQEEGVSYGRGQGWSVLAGDTVGANNTVFSGQLGWPGISLGLLHGANSKLDIGGKFTFNYGQEGLVEVVEPGLKLQAWVRLMLAQTSKVSLAVTFQPGPLFYFHDGDTDVGLALPVALVAGIPVGSALMLNVGLDIPFHVYFGTGGGPVFPLLVGGGMEYFLDRSLAVNFNVRMGPSIFPDSGRRGRSEAYFTLEALFGVAYRF